MSSERGQHTMKVLALGGVVGLLMDRMAPKPPNPSMQKADPSVYSARGSYVPLVIGRRRVGPIIAWVGDRKVYDEKAGAGKGSSGKDAKVKAYKESGWHVVCVGPVSKLHGVWIDGKYYKTPATPATHADGATLKTKDGATFKIRWGFQDPSAVDSTVASKIGISSKWPFLCTVFWTQLRLGHQPRWPIVNYDVECNVQTTHLVKSPPYGQRSASYNGNSYDVIAMGRDSSAPREYWMETNNQVGSAPPTSLAAIQDFTPGRACTYTGDATVGTLSLTVYKCVQYPPLAAGGLNVIRVYFQEEYNPFVGTPPFGDLTAGARVNEGFNPAHIMAQLLFDPYPHGLALNKSLFDLSYLEEAALRLDDEGVRASIIAQDGFTGVQALTGLMADMGLMLSWRVSGGVFIPKIIRPSSVVPLLPRELVLEPNIEVESIHERVVGDTFVYTFMDRDLLYKANTIAISDDGKAYVDEIQRAKTVNLETITDFDSAAVVAERRSQEDMASQVGYTVHTCREARKLFPGQPLDVEDVDPRLRIMEVEIDPISGKVVLECLTDNYSVDETTYVRGADDAGAYFDSPADQDPYLRVIEPPPLMYRERIANAIFIARVRRGGAVKGANVWASLDGTTYTSIAQEVESHVGGELLDEIPSTWPYDMSDYEPEATLDDTDADLLVDLTADDENYHAGRQVALINDEVFLLREAELVSGTTYKLKGLTRARFGTRRETHAIGDSVFIVDVTRATPIKDLLIQPGKTLYTKVQPVNDRLVADLDAITAIETELVGSATRPMAPVNIRPTSFGTGEDITFSWGYFNRNYPGTGAGEQGFGDQVVDAPVEGVFELRFINSMDEVVRTSLVEGTNTMFYNNENLVIDFDGEPDWFTVEIRQLLFGKVGAVAETTVTKA